MTLSSLVSRLTAPARAREGTSRAGSVYVTALPAATEEILRHLARRVAELNGLLLVGHCDKLTPRPLSGLSEIVDALAGRVLPIDPALIERYGPWLITLLPQWRREQCLAYVPEFRSGLADFALHLDPLGLSEFDKRRNMTGVVVANSVRFVVDSISVLARSRSGPIVLFVENVDGMDRVGLRAMRTCASYLDGTAFLCVSSHREDTEAIGSQAPWAAVSLEVDTPLGVNEPLTLTELQRDVLETCSVLHRPFRVTELEALIPSDSPSLRAAVEQLADAHVLSRVDATRYTWLSGHRRALTYSKLTPERRDALHKVALSIESDDPVAAVSHALASHSYERAVGHTLRAIQTAWALSACDCAAHYVTLLLKAPGGLDSCDEHVTRALLHYEAGNYDKTDELLRMALAREHAAHPPLTLRRLLGYNAIFGLGQWDAGVATLTEVAAEYAGQGRTIDAAYTRNAVAFGLWRGGRTDEAVATETAALEGLGGGGREDPFLITLLHLNMGRLYRAKGDHWKAREAFQQGLADVKGCVSPYALVPFYASLAHLEEACGCYADALGAHHRCLELCRDLWLDGVSDHFIWSLSRPGVQRPTGLVRGDECLFWLHLNLSGAFSRLGQYELSRVCMEAVQSLAGPGWKAPDACVPEATEPGSSAALRHEERPRRPTNAGVSSRLSRMFDRIADGQAATELVGKALNEGATVAVVGSWMVGQTGLTRSLVLCDPRNAPAATRLAAELGAARRPRAAIGLCEAAQLIGGGVVPVPYRLQQVTLESSLRKHYTALTPIRCTIQLVDGNEKQLHGIVDAFARVSGTPFTAVIPFHLRDDDLICTLEQAYTACVLASVDYLLFSGRLYAKRQIRIDDSLRDFIPTLARGAALRRTERGLIVAVRSWLDRRHMRLHPQMQALLDLCDGTRTVGQVVEQAAAVMKRSDAEFRLALSTLVHKLWRAGAIRLELADASSALVSSSTEAGVRQPL